MSEGGGGRGGEAGGEASGGGHQTLEHSHSKSQLPTLGGVKGHTVERRGMGSRGRCVVLQHSFQTVHSAAVQGREDRQTDRQTDRWTDRKGKEAETSEHSVQNLLHAEEGSTVVHPRGVCEVVHQLLHMLSNVTCQSHLRRGGRAVGAELYHISTGSPPARPLVCCEWTAAAERTYPLPLETGIPTDHAPHNPRTCVHVLCMHVQMCSLTW